MHLYEFEAHYTISLLETQHNIQISIVALNFYGCSWTTGLPIIKLRLYGKDLYQAMIS